MTKLTHPEFASEQSFHERLSVLPAATVYAQLTGREEWGVQMERLVPHHMREGFVRYIAIGRRSHSGHFLQALINNDLMGAFGRADQQNAASMRDWVQFLYNFTPAGAYGHPKAYSEYEGILAAYREEEDA